MRAVAKALETGADVKLSMRAGDVALLLQAAAEGAVLSSAISEVTICDEEYLCDAIETSRRSLDDILKKTHLTVLPAVES